MSYLVLARKYRPKTFAEVAGQDVLTRTLRGAIEESRVGHAYLFCGPRGTGKTTLARIFAKALNCERGPTPEPCGECERCHALDSGQDVDVVEIDAASHTGVENVRELREQAAYAPMAARHKIFIVDEVHMLSKGAFNALLKTLEEPPGHVKFLFATTEPERVPDTILSRCQILRLGLFDDDVIASRLDHVLAAEDVTPESGTTHALARLARGSMRDALSITDQLLALVGREPKVADVHRMAGAGGPERIERAVERLEAGDGPGALEALGDSEGSEEECVDALLRDLRGALLVALCPEESRLVAAFATRRETLGALGKRLGPARLEIWLEELLHLRERLGRTPEHGRLLLELTLLALARPETGLPLAELQERLARLEERLGAPPKPGAASPSVRAAPPAKQPEPRTAPSPERAPERKPESDRRLDAAASAPRAAVLVPQPATSRPTPPRTPDEPSTPAPARAKRRSPTSGALGIVPTWEAWLADLGRSDEALGRILANRGRLLDLDAGAARVQLQRLLPEEREILARPATQTACEDALERVAGQRLTVILEDTASVRPGMEDAFTKRVTELFEGSVEERS